MSVFTGEHLTTGDNQQGNTGTTDDTNAGYLKKLVEAKGEQWSNPEVLAKGKLEADQYISELKGRLAELEKVQGEQDYSKQLLEQLRDKAAEPIAAKPEVPNNNSQNGTEQKRDTNAELSEEAINRLVEKSLTAREQRATQTQNLTAVDNQLEESFGTEATSVVAKKSVELGISVERMKEIAAESPSAFFTLIGEKPKVPPVLRQGSLRTEGVNFNSSGERNWNYYQKLRKSNKATYRSSVVQKQMMEDRARLGDTFYS